MPRELLPLKAFLDAHGFRSFIAILPGEDNIANANYLRDFVNEVEQLTGVPQVDAVGFSMGGLSLRYYIRFLDGEQEVRRYISIDTPQYGDPAACLLAPEAGGQMCPGSPFLIGLNQGDDTPGSVSYTTILNQEGDIPASRLYGGASEVMVSAPHGELLTSPDVDEAVRAALSQ
jgi:triacylglycerol lipase